MWYRNSNTTIFINGPKTQFFLKRFLKFLIRKILSPRHEKYPILFCFLCSFKWDVAQKNRPQNGRETSETRVAWFLRKSKKMEKKSSFWKSHISVKNYLFGLKIWLQRFLNMAYRMGIVRFKFRIWPCYAPLALYWIASWRLS